MSPFCDELKVNQSMDTTSMSSQLRKASSFVFLTSSVFIAACGGGGSGSSSNNPPPPPAPQVLTGVFLDSAVQNINYRTPTQEGVTNSRGEYQYLAGEDVTFFIGDLELPSTAAQSAVTPMSMANSESPLNSVTVNILRLLQTLDEDGDPANGLQIPGDASVTATSLDFNLPPADFAVDLSLNQLITSVAGDNQQLVPVHSALEHFAESLVANQLASAADTDSDGVPDVIDAAPSDAAQSFDSDLDGVPDASDDDDDNDGVVDSDDAFPLDSSEQLDTDLDGIGNNRDSDDDGDTVADIHDVFPLDSLESIDTDGDGIGNNADTDDDNDGAADSEDAFPLDLHEQIDTDGDGIGNNEDQDDDGDDVADSEDAFPLDPLETIDTDGDGTGNYADTDDDNDGVVDFRDAFPLDSSESLDSDLDGIGDNADAYPSQVACYTESEGNGTDCYATILSEKNALDIVTAESGQFFFFDEEQHAIVSLDISSSQYTAFPVVQQDVEQIRSLAYSEAHARIYAGFSNGRIVSLDVEVGQVNDFASTAESVDELASAGSYLLAQDPSGAINSHYIFDQNGNQADWVEWQDRSEYFAWSSTLNRIYYLDGTSSAYLNYEEIDFFTGIVSGSGETYYSNDYLFGPIVASSDGLRLFFASGDIVDAETLELQSSLGPSFDDAMWLADGGLVTFRHNEARTIIHVARLNSLMEVVEERQISGRLLKTLKGQEKISLLIREQQNLQLVEYVPNDDLDGDGVLNTVDAFPQDIAAAVDSDGDGYPDSWNEGYSQTDSSGGLILDSFPNDSACHLAEHGVNSLCDINALVHLESAEKMVNSDGVIYVLSASDLRINRWDSTTENYLNPILIDDDAFVGSPLSLAVASDGAIVVGFDSGRILRYPSDGTGGWSQLQRISKPVRNLISAGDFLIAVGLARYSELNFYLLNQTGEVLSQYSSYDSSTNFAYSPESQRIYWLTWDDVASLKVDAESGEFQDFRRYYGHSISNGSTFISISDDASQLVVGQGAVLTGYPEETVRSALPTAFDFPQDATFNDFRWFSDVGVALMQTEEQYSLNIYSSSLESALGNVPLMHEVRRIFPVGDDLILLNNTDSGLVLDKIAIQADADGDAIPAWWENASAGPKIRAVPSRRSPSGLPRVRPPSAASTCHIG